MQAHLPWLSQGDIFVEIPLLFIDLAFDGQMVPNRVVEGPALLVTHNCVIDKATNSGRPATKRLHFLPLVAVASQDPGRQALLRRAELQPYEVMYLGECGHAEESFVVLSEITSVPTGYFDAFLDSCEAHPEANAGDRYLTPRRHAARLGRLDDAQVEQLFDKLNAFWTRRLPHGTE